MILWGFMIVYLIYLLNLAKKGTEEEEEFKDMPIWKCIVGIVLGAVMIVGGSNLVVDGASDIASAMGISDRIIGLTIVAFGTSLPELVTSVSAAKKGNAGIAIGNIVGSNIFSSVEKARLAFVTSLMRGFIVIIACAFILSAIAGMTGVWSAYPVSEAITAVVSTAGIIGILRKRQSS